MQVFHENNFFQSLISTHQMALWFGYKSVKFHLFDNSIRKNVFLPFKKTITLTLIKSISGIRGTIGGLPGENLTPLDIVKFTLAYGNIILKRGNNPKVVIGRDGRISGEMVRSLVTGTLMSIGIDVVDLGLSTTPTVEMAVVMEEAGGGIILTASHNPREWNALKLLNEKGEFIDAETGQQVVEGADEDCTFVSVEELGTYRQDDTYIDKHIAAILELPLVNAEAIKAKKYKIAVDCINSTGSLAIPKLLKVLGVENVLVLNGDITGRFAHDPEPLAENLTSISQLVRNENADLGFVVDPDVDRLAIICEDGEMFGEEYTLVAVADYILSHNPGPTVSNLSSTIALKHITEKSGNTYEASKVGEVNVVAKMKETGAVIGGEGNGGIIYPELHYGRDALVGIALFLSHMSTSNAYCSFLRAKYPNFVISKNKIQLTPEIDVDDLLTKIANKYREQPQIKIDGVKIFFDSNWVHLRKSNTEPIIRIYSESTTEVIANNLADKIKADIRDLLQGEEI